MQMISLQWPPLLGEGIDVVRMPADKAIGHRGVMLGALGRGRTMIHGAAPGDDVRRTIVAVQGLGVQVEWDGAETLAIEGVAGRWASGTVLDCGASGTTLRLLCGLLAGGEHTTTLRVAPQLARRPIGHVLHLLRGMGGAIACHDWGTERAHLVIEGRPLCGIDCALPVASAQLKTAVGLAALRAEGPTTVIEPVPTRDHFERLLPAIGLRSETVDQCCREGTGARHWSGRRFYPGIPRGTTIHVPGDISSAAIWIVLGVLLRTRPLQIPGVGLNPTRIGLLHALKRMGAVVTWQIDQPEAVEPVGTITVARSPLHGTTITRDEIPTLIDELPLLILTAALADGPTTIHGVSALTTKESDRLTLTMAACRAAGLQVDRPDPDRLVISGTPAARFHPQTFSTANDHRMTMLYVLFSLLARHTGPSHLARADAAAVTKSYPAFWHDLGRICGVHTVAP